MKFTTISLLSLAALVLAQDIDDGEIPGPCRDICRSTVQVSRQCDATHDDDDDGFITCVCTSTDASSLIPNCEACVARYDEPDNDVRDFVRSCDFTTASTWTTPNQAAVTGGQDSSTSSATSAPRSTSATTTFTGTRPTTTRIGGGTASSTVLTTTFISGSNTASSTTTTGSNGQATVIVVLQTSTGGAAGALVTGSPAVGAIAAGVMGVAAFL